jgi:hypothetical protein
LVAWRVAVSVCTGVPLALDPEYKFTVTVAKSPPALPAIPAKVGVEFDRAAPLAGCVSVTLGAVVSTVNVFAELEPVVPKMFCCVAWEVYVPSASAAGPALTE